MKWFSRPIIAVTTIALVAILVPLLPLPDPAQGDAGQLFASPSLLHPLGQDAFGRDVLARLLWGARKSVLLAVVSAVLAGVFGGTLGLLGRYGRGIELLLRIPPLVFGLLMVTLLGPGTGTLILVLIIVLLPGFARAVSSSLGTSFRTLDAEPILRQFGIAATSAVVLESGLSFLGLGVMPPELSLGGLIGEARLSMTQAPFLLLWPCLALIMVVLPMNMLSDGPEFWRARWYPKWPVPPAGRPQSSAAVLDVRNLSIEMQSPDGPIEAVHNVSFAVRAGETLAIVGEGGAGKSLIALAVLGLLPPSARITQGVAWLQGHNLLRLDEPGFSRVRGGVLTMLFQDPLSALNPVHRIGAQLTEVMHAHFSLSAHEASDEAITLLKRVGIADAKRCARAFPHELPTETRQRVLIAMAVANDPRLLIADEPAASLDVAVQPEIMALLADLRRELGMGMVVISRDMPAVAEIADRVMVMQAGSVVAQGSVRDVLAQAYGESRTTRATISAKRS